MNEQKILKACEEVLGNDAFEYCLHVGYELRDLLKCAALECFDTNRHDEHAEVIRQAREELAE